MISTQMNSKIEEYYRYLSAWCRTRNNRYETVATENIPEILTDIIKSGNRAPIKTFKERFLIGEISLGIYPVGLSVEYKKDCFDKDMKLIEEFEKTHSIE